jgi:hypothetical protein
VSVFGNVYYLAHAESFLALTLFLMEWAGKRRPALLGACLRVSFLARPTTILAAIPFGLYLIWTRRSELRAMARSAVVFGLPMATAIAFYGWFNWVRRLAVRVGLFDLAPDAAGLVARCASG